MSRRDSALHASCTGGVVDLTTFSDRDIEEICAVNEITLPYCPDTRRVLTTEYHGSSIRDAVNDAVATLFARFGHVRVTDVTVRPWQRWWRRTPAKRLIPSQPRRSGRP